MLALADKLEPQARAAFIAAVERLRSSINIDRLAELIADGRLTSAELTADLKPLADDLQAVANVAQQAFLQTGQQSATVLSGRLGAASLRFDVANPLAVAAAQRMAANLVVEITTETRMALRALITRSFTDGLTARQVARLVRPLIGLTSSQTRAVLKYREQMVKMGHDQDTATQLARKYADRKLRERAETIARTEIMRASNAGQRAVWMMAIEQGLLPPRARRRWTVTPDDRLCQACAALDGEEREMGESFPDTFDPPLHPSCRCVTVLVS